MDRVKYGEGNGYTIEDFIIKELTANRGTHNAISKQQLEKMCEEKNITFKKTTTKAELLDMLIEKGLDLRKLAKEVNIGVSAYNYQSVFDDLSRVDITKLETAGALTKVGELFIGGGRYMDLFELEQYEKMTEEDMRLLLKKYCQKGDVKIRLSGSRKDINAAVEKLESVFEILSVSKFYPDRESNDFRQYIEASL